MNKKYIMPFLDNSSYSYSEFEFDTNIVEPLIHFVVDNVQNIIEQTRGDYSDILLCMPEYLIQFLKQRYVDSIVNAIEVDGHVYFCNVKVQVAYNNKVTLFYNSLIPSRIIKYTKEL